MNYYERHLGDYARDTGHLTMLEHGAYTALLDRYYATEKPITADQAYRVARASTKPERAAVDAVLEEYFYRDGEFWKHGKVEEVIAEYRAKSQKAKDAAAKRWHSDGNADALQTHEVGNTNQYPVTSNQEPTKKPARKRAETPCPADWIPADAWQAFVEHRHAKRAKLTAKAVELIVADLDGYRKRGAEPRVVLEWAIKQGHTGLFFKPDPKTVPAQARPPSCARCAKESTRRLEGDYYCDDHKPIERVGPHVAALAAAKRVAA